MSAENVELKQRKTECEILKKELQELEEQYHLAQTNQSIDDEDKLIIEIRKVCDVIDNIEKDIGEKALILSERRVIIEQKDIEISKQREIIAELDNKAKEIQYERERLQREINTNCVNHRDTKQRIDDNMRDTEELNKAKIVEKTHLHNILKEGDFLKEKLFNLQSTLETAKRQTKDLESRKSLAKSIKEEVNSLNARNNELQEQRNKFIKKIKEFETESGLLERKLEDIIVLIKMKEIGRASCRARVSPHV